MTALSSPFGRKCRTLRDHVRRHGVAAGARLLVGLPLERTGILRIGICYALPDAVRALESVRPIPELEIREMGPDEVRARAREREDWFFPGAVEASLERGDVCLGGFLDGVLVTSTWYATEPLFVLGDVIAFGPDCVWAQRMFTKPEFRGRGLSPALNKAGARYWAERGRTTHLNVVEWTNDSSRRLQEKTGYRRIGTVVCLGRIESGKVFLFGGREFGLRLLGRGG